MSDYSEDCIQGLTTEPWWEKTGDTTLRFGSLVWSFVQFVDQVPLRLSATRSQAEDHSKAIVKAEPLYARGRSPRTLDAPLPVAGLPDLQGAHCWSLQRAKLRPCIIVSETQVFTIDAALTHGMSKSATHFYSLAAPYYGADQAARAGYNPRFVEKIKHAYYPQWFWDHLPVNGAGESILRFDHIHPLGHHQNAFEHTGFILGEAARKQMREWIDWFCKGSMSANISDFKMLMAQYEAAADATNGSS